MAKTYCHLKNKICSLQNLIEADKKARKGKKRTKSMHDLDKNYLDSLLALQKQLLDGTYITSPYNTFTIYEPKEREIYSLPYNPDRIVHHAIMNVLEPIWKNIFIKDTYSSIKDRGIHAAMKAVKKCLKQCKGKGLYCLKMDIKKFYPSIDHDILKKIIRKSIGDKWLLNLLDGIIDSAKGVPIGNYLSQYLANLYLTYFDHRMKELYGAKHYFRYCDDIVIIGTKSELSFFQFVTELDLKNNLKLTLKKNWRIFPVELGIDFTGYVMTPTHTKLRKSIKKNMMRKVNRLIKANVSQKEFQDAMGTYKGWLKYCNAAKLTEKINKLYDNKPFNFCLVPSNVFKV